MYNMNILISEVLKCEKVEVNPFIVFENEATVYPEYSVKINRNTVILKYNDRFSDNIYLFVNKDYITAKRTFINCSDKEIRIKELGIEINGISFGEDPSKDYFYHNENPRIYEKMTFPIDYDRTGMDAKDSGYDATAGNRWADPGVVCERIGRSPYQPFPAILLSNYNSNNGIVHGSLSQKIFYHNYLVSHIDNRINLKIFSSFKCVDYLEAEKGRILTDEWYLGTTDKADDIEEIFTKYSEQLRKKLPVGYGRSNINRDNLVWGSWNDGVFLNVNENIVIKEAEFLKENFPTVKWIQLDDGYAVHKERRMFAHGLGVPYEGEEGIDKGKFPNGLKYLTDKIREIGLRPAIWIGGACPRNSKIVQEHPEWFIDYSYRMKSAMPLDISKHEPREYAKSAIKTLCLEYGFEGVKHDFWSYPFEDSNDLYEIKNKSGYENREWWLKEMRNCIPNDGHFQTGCDIVMGNPFLGEFFTNYRYGIDIGSGNWDYVKTNYLWGAACFATHTGDLFVPNSDSVGMFSELSENEAMFALNYCLVTHSMVEIAGKLSESKNEKRMKILKKAVCNPNNGQDVYFVNYDYRKNEYAVPEIMYFETPHFSVIPDNKHMPLLTFGVFNIGEEEKTYEISLKAFKLRPGNYIITDVWSGEQFDTDEFFSVTLDKHSSKLYAISKKEQFQIFDSNIKITDSELKNNGLLIKTEYPLKDAELLLSFVPSEILINGIGVLFNQDGNRVTFDAVDFGEILIKI